MRPAVSPARRAAALALLRLATAGLGLIETLLRHRLIGTTSAGRAISALRPLVALSRNLLAW